MSTKIKASNIDANAIPANKIDFNGSIDTHLIPDTNVTYDLGSAEYKFRDLYLSSATIHLGDVKITKNETTGIVEIKDSSDTVIGTTNTYDQDEVDAQMDDIIAEIESLSTL